MTSHSSSRGLRGAGGFGDLEGEQADGGGVRGEHGVQFFEEGGRFHLLGRDVDGDAPESNARGGPEHDLAAHFLDREPAELQDQAGAFRKRDELAGETIPRTGLRQRIRASRLSSRPRLSIKGW